MSPQSFQRVRDLYVSARQVPPEQRRAFLDRELAGGADDAPDIRAEVESLLADAERSHDGFLDSPAVAIPFDSPGLLGVQDTLGALPEQLGDFRLGRVVGEGGMGIVYEAEQQHPRRTVALKLIRPLFVTAKLLRRFEHEADLLARLEHPGIARVYEAGTFPTRAGPQPFFAMEFVRGRALNKYVAENTLSTRQRLELLVKICDAVQHAHQRGVIHRDLKPSNILVDQHGQPKVLDFGVARAVDVDGQSVTMQTETGQLVGTLPYMSPEQAGGDVHSIDTRSDVYALGVIAFELLGERLPYSVRDKSMGEAVQVIRDVEPTRLGSIDRHLGGDVETIVLKALEKDRERRYATAGQLAADVTRFLNYEPISARPPGTWYQLSRFARRNRALVGGVVAVGLVLLLGIIATSWQAIRARRAEHDMRLQKDEAQQSSAVANAVKKFMSEMLGAVDPSESQGDEITVRQQLDRAARSVGEQFADQPLVESEIRYTIGNLYVELGRPKEAEEQLKIGLARRRVAGVNSDDDLLTTLLMKRLFMAYFDQGRVDEGLALNRDVLARNRRLLGDDHPETIESLRSIGGVLLKLHRNEEAEPYVQEALRRARATMAEDDPQRLATIESIAFDAYSAGRLDEAERLWRELLASYRRIRGENHKDTLRLTGNLAMALNGMGRYADAEPLLRGLLERSARKVGLNHPDTLDVELKLVVVLIELRRHADAEPIARHVYEQYQSTRPADDPMMLNAATDLALVIAPLGHRDEADRLLRGVLDRTRQKLGPTDPATLDATYQFANFLLDGGDAESALPLAKELFDRCEEPKNAPAFAPIYLPVYGLALTDLKRYDAAEPALRTAHERLVAAGMTGNAQSRAVVRALVDVYNSTGRPDQANTWRAKLAPATRASQATQSATTQSIR